MAALQWLQKLQVHLTLGCHKENEAVLIEPAGAGCPRGGGRMPLGRQVERYEFLVNGTHSGLSLFAVQVILQKRPASAVAAETAMASFGLRRHTILSRCLRSLARPLFQPSSGRGFSSTAVPILLERVGFIGLGNMGFPMATNLINAGYTVTVHDIDIGTMEKFSERGVPAKETPREVAESSDVIITMLPSSSNVLDVYTGQNGLLSSGNHLSPWLFIDSSTIDPQTSRLLSAKVSKYHLKGKKGYAENPIMLDAPVSGGVPAAEAGTLTFMIGGMEEAYLAAKPLFLSMVTVTTQYLE